MNTPAENEEREHQRSMPVIRIDQEEKREFLAALQWYYGTFTRLERKDMPRITQGYFLRQAIAALIEKRTQQLSEAGQK